MKSFPNEVLWAMKIQNMQLLKHTLSLYAKKRRCKDQMKEDYWEKIILILIFQVNVQDLKKI